MSDMWKSVSAPIHRAGVPFVAGGVVATFLAAFAWAPLAAVLALVTAWMIYFFRDPDRAHETWMSKRDGDDAFWERYKNFGATAEAYCAG